MLPIADSICLEKVRELSACLPVEIRIGSGDRCCDAESQNLMRVISRIHLGRLEDISCSRVNALSMCIGNNHSTIMAWRKRAESARTYRIWSRIVRRMVVVLYPEKAVNWASFMTHARPERKFAASLADQSGFEPKVAV